MATAMEPEEERERLKQSIMQVDFSIKHVIKVGERRAGSPRQA